MAESSDAQPQGSEVYDWKGSFFEGSHLALTTLLRLALLWAYEIPIRSAMEITGSYYSPLLLPHNVCSNAVEALAGIASEAAVQSTHLTRLAYIL